MSDARLNAELDALGQLASAMEELLEQLRTASTPDKRAALGTEFAARVDGMRTDIGLRHGLADRDAVAAVARALVRVSDVLQACRS